MICSSQEKNIKNFELFLNVFRGKIIFFVESKKNYYHLLNIISYFKILPKQIYEFNIKQFLDINKSEKYFFIFKEKKYGFIDQKNNIACLCVKDILNNQLICSPFYQYHKKNQGKELNHQFQLNLNQLVVHFKHGIGRYKGLIMLENNGINNEYCIIEYAEKAKLYVPITSLNLINHYSNTSNENILLNKLGNDQWIRERKKIEKKIYDSTALLLDIYAKRATKLGFSFNLKSKKYNNFCKKFPFVLTIDQDKAINEVLNDMEKPIPMDRLICGDVGFGKTEIAMRASFIATVNKKQVAILVPTTLLVQQHYNNFVDRFSHCSVRIKMLSRLCKPKEISLSINEAKEGKLNILIGTHQMLLKNIQWFNLGLLIIDEEHKFGVIHKEKIKSLFTNIDILTLTATPIPRTLNMAMHGIRDLSIITTPPEKRLAIKTIIIEYDINLIRKTILKELLRGGQIYYIYNSIQNIEKKAIQLNKLIPEAKIKIGHGKMNSTNLKKIMHDFYNQKFNILLCTTIIETGIDIPYANTMIIEKAEQFGLAQLHQLRGRIGRSHQQAYVLLLIKNYKNINDNAKKRLDSIYSCQNIGDGFILSNQDLEIRGMGEIIGHDQSGHMSKIGVVLYKEMLQNTISMYKKWGKQYAQKINVHNTEIEINIPALLPETYISDVNTRINFYKKISNCHSKNDINNIKNELIYHFGIMTEPVKNLITITVIRILSNNIGIKKIYSRKKEGFIIFHHNHDINFNWLVEKIKLEPNQWNIISSNKLKFIHNLFNNQDILKWILNFIKLLYKNRIFDNKN
ncbi:Transcription-repair-coupling factor [Buchnera aphidicola (Eriosoma grossulariae)]|uniref:transcription-repair coupling factor n=1 Tax=Buchnera aphidicola TaxID=9 RepID=UPI00346427DF